MKDIFVGSVLTSHWLRLVGVVFVVGGTAGGAYIASDQSLHQRGYIAAAVIAAAFTAGSLMAALGHIIAILLELGDRLGPERSLHKRR